VEVTESGLQEMFAAVLPLLDERQRRLLAGAQARALGHGGIGMVARTAGMSRTTVSAALAEVREGPAPSGRVRAPGAGRPSLISRDPELLERLDALVEPGSRGDPMCPLRWTSKSTSHLAQALTGHFDANHARLARSMLVRLNLVEQAMAELDGVIADACRPWQHQIELLQTIPGVGPKVAEVFIAETGGDMSRFPTAAHLAAWAGLAPAMKESAGRQSPAGKRYGNKWLTAMLVEAAGSVGRMHGKNYLAAQHARLSTDPTSPFVRLASAFRRTPKSVVVLRSVGLSETFADRVDNTLLENPTDYFSALADLFHLPLPHYSASDRDQLWRRVWSQYEDFLGRQREEDARED